MTAFDRFEQRLPALFDDLAVVQMPDYADALLARTAATRQRPGWTFPERWIPMSALTRSLAGVPRFQLRLVVAVALLVVAAIVGAVLAGSFTPRRPAPFGPAANGQIAYIDGTGQILAGDPVTSQSKVIISGTGNSRIAVSRDGSRIVFARGATGGGVDVMVANLDGSHVTKVTPDAISDPGFIAWSPRGDRIAITTLAGELVLYDASGSGQAVNLSQTLGAGPVQIGSGNNDQTTHLFRPPSGDELLLTNRAGTLIQVAHVDGTGLKTLFDPKSLGLGYTILDGAEWSPDGSRIVVMVSTDVDSAKHLYLLDADGGNPRPLSSLSTDPLEDEGHPQWSPNGTQVAFQHWTRHPSGGGQDFFGINVVDVASGKLHDLGPTLINGAMWAWSPDGLSILELPAAPSGDGHMLIVNVATDLENRLPWVVNDLNWQRTLP